MPPTITTTHSCNSGVDATTVNIVSVNSPVLINRLKDWQWNQNNLIIYNISETEVANQQDLKTDLLS